MSIRCTAWAWSVAETVPTANALLVLLKLADMAWDSGKCWPAHAYLAKGTHIGVRKVRSSMQLLEGMGFLRTEPRPGQSDMIWLAVTATICFDDVPDDEVFEGGKRGRPRKTPAPGTENPDKTSARGADEPIEPKIGTSVVVVARKPFDVWWAHYPLKKAKDAAIVAFEKAMRRIEAPDPLQILTDGADRYVEEIARTGVLVKHPATWLNGGCWNDEPDTNGSQTDGRRATGINHAADRADARIGAMVEGVRIAAVTGRRRWSV